jgi:Family of unknown function (DUF5678)
VLENEFQYFVANQNDLFKHFPGQYLAIKDQKVIGVYDNKIDAYLETQEEHELGSFLVQFCSLDKEIFIQNFTPNSMIA